MLLTFPDWASAPPMAFDLNQSAPFAKVPCSLCMWITGSRIHNLSRFFHLMCCLQKFLAYPEGGRVTNLDFANSPWQPQHGIRESRERRPKSTSNHLLRIQSKISPKISTLDHFQVPQDAAQYLPQQAANCYGSDQHRRWSNQQRL